MKKILVDVACMHKLMTYSVHRDRGADRFHSKKKSKSEKEQKKKTHSERKGRKVETLKIYTSQE